MFAMVKLIPITMTLPGIAGLILTIGVAADANIVIFERVKEEVRAGRSVPVAISQGYKKGLTAIIDANVVTFMVAFILFILATAGVKGFAFALGVGTLVSFLTAVLLTQAVLGALGRSKIITHPSALGAQSTRQRFRWDYMGKSKYFFAVSGVILLIGALGDRRQGPEPRHRLHVGLARRRRAQPERERAGDPRHARRRSGSARRRSRRSRGTEFKSNEAFQISTDTLTAGRARQGRGSAEQGVRRRDLQLPDDRADVRQHGRQGRDHRDHRVADRDQQLHRAQIRMEIRGAGADRVDARPADHGRRLRAVRIRGDDRDGRRPAHDPRAIRSTTP